jgi:hypothetical protein
MCPLSWTLDDITANGVNSTISYAKYQNEMANFRQQIEETIEAHPTRSRWTSERKAAYVDSAADIFSANFLPGVVVVGQVGKSPLGFFVFIFQLPKEILQFFAEFRIGSLDG